MSRPAPCIATVSLVCHDQTPCTIVRSVSVDVARAPDAGLQFVYRLTGDLARLRMPAAQAPAPADRLWAHTCFEVFVAAREGKAYREWNFSPSGQWAAYDFTGYRERADARRTEAPEIRVVREGGCLALEAQLGVPRDFGPSLQLGLSAVIEDTDGALYYWALRHPQGKPDFHHCEAFALSLDLATPPSPAERTI